MDFFLQRRLLALLLECFGGIFCDRLIAAFKRQLLAPSDLTVEARASLLEGLGALKSTLLFLTRLHKGVFYWGGEYFQLSKRLAGIRYVCINLCCTCYSSNIDIAFCVPDDSV